MYSVQIARPFQLGAMICELTLECLSLMYAPDLSVLKRSNVTVMSDYDIMIYPCRHCSSQDWIQDLVPIKFLPDGRPSFHCTLSLHQVQMRVSSTGLGYSGMILHGSRLETFGD